MMRARPLPLLLVALATAPLLAGCGGQAASQAASQLGTRLTVFSSLPLTGPEAAAGQQIVDGERLALGQVHSRVGRFTIGFDSLNDAGAEGAWNRGQTASNATLASKDRRTIAYIGDYNSGATAISLPHTNQAGILQISPRSPYVGLTSAFDAGQGDPERFYPSESRSFVRLLPGDPVQGAAQVALMRRLGVASVYLLNDGEPFRAPLASIVGGEAKRAGIKVAGEETVELSGATGESSFSGLVEAITESGAQAVFFSGDAGEGAAALWRQLHTADPQLLLLGTSEMAEPSFTTEIGAAAGRTYLTTPVLPSSRYSRRAQQVLADFRRRYHAKPTSNVLYGYASMEIVIDAIRTAGATADEREAVIESVFAMRDRGSVLGSFSVLGDGETTIARYAVDRVHAGMPVFWRELSVSGPHVP